MYQIYAKKLVKNNALARVSQYTNLPKTKILMNAFFDSQFKHFYSCECVIVAQIIGKLTGSTKDALSFITTNSYHLKIYLKSKALLLFMKDMYSGLSLIQLPLIPTSP